MAEAISMEIDEPGTAPAAPAEGATWRSMRALRRADVERLHSVLAQRHGGPRRWGRLHPSRLAVGFYRLARYFHLNGRGLSARIATNLNTLLTGADISPAADYGPGLVILSPAGTALYGKAGRNLTVMPCAGVGGELGRREDVGGGPGLPVLGDDIVLEPHVGVLGPCRIGDRVLVRSGALVTTDVPADTIVEAPRARFRERSDLA